MTQATLQNIQHGTLLIHKKKNKEAIAYYPRPYGEGKDQQTHNQITVLIGNRRAHVNLENYWLKG